jgi:hypothetical protein
VADAHAELGKAIEAAKDHPSCGRSTTAPPTSKSRPTTPRPHQPTIRPSPQPHRALTALCADLTATETTYPGTDLVLVYSVKSF